MKRHIKILPIAAFIGIVSVSCGASESVTENKQPAQNEIQDHDSVETAPSSLIPAATHPLPSSKTTTELVSEQSE